MSVKIVLIGNTDAGRTSLFERYITDHCPTKESTVTRATCIIREYKDQKIEFWNTPKKENALYMEFAHAFIIVVDGSKEDEVSLNISKHLEKIARLVPNSSVIIAANKNDKKGNVFDENYDTYDKYYRDLINETYPNIKFLGLVRTSAITGHNVGLLFEQAMDGAIEQFELNEKNEYIVETDETVNIMTKKITSQRRCV